jgi:hypothetical protein
VFPLSNTSLPAQKITGPPGVMVAVGNGLTTTVVAADATKQPDALVMVTPYVPVVVAV